MKTFELSSTKRKLILNKFPCFPYLKNVLFDCDNYYITEAKESILIYLLTFN